MKRITALILAFSLLMSSTAMSAGFSIDTPLADGLTYIESTGFLDDGSDSHTFTFEYIPGKSAMPVVAWGEWQKSRNTLTKIAELYGEDAVAGINADFFSFTTGIPLGALVSEGRFLSSPVKNNALAISQDGTLYIGTPDITSTISVGEETFDFYYNKYPQPYSLYITDSTYYGSTASAFSCLEIILVPETTVLTVNSTTLCTVAQVTDDTMDTPITEDTFVLTVPKSHKAYTLLKELQPGDSIEIKVSGSDIWSSAASVVGGGDIIVKDSVYIPETADEYSDKVRYARTAVGLRADGSAVFFAVNGKKEGYSSGMKLEELAQALISMGAVTVLNLDGGGSTTVGVKLSGEEKLHVTNKPTDGYPRGLSNAILFLNTASPDGVVTNVSLFPNTYFVLPNTILESEEHFFDASLTAVEAFTPYSKEYYPLTDGVEIAQDYFKITDIDLYEREIVGVYMLDEFGKTVSDNKTFYVPETLDSIVPILDSQVLNVGESTHLTVSAHFQGFDVASSTESFKWSFDENNAETLPEGVLAQNDVARLLSDGTVEVITDKLFVTTTLTAEYNGVKGDINIYVGMPDLVIDDFEPEETEPETPEEAAIPEETVENITSEEPSPTTEEAPAENRIPETEQPEDETAADGDTTSEIIEETEEITEGYRSPNGARLENGTLTYETPVEINLTPKNITVMYKGKYTGNAKLVILTSSGEELEIPYETLQDYSDITDWTKITAVIPENVKGSIYLKSPFASNEQEAVIIDDIIACYGFTSPVFDDVENSWASEYINEIYDMGLIGGYYDNGKLLFAPNRQITRAEFAKLVSNYQRYTYEQSPENQMNFVDGDEIPAWAVEFVGAVSQNDIMRGRAVGDGTLAFAPNEPITRTEAMIVLSRIMPELEADGSIAFEDTSEIPDWALDGVSKIVTSGIVTGYEDNTIRPYNNITRAETAVVFTRLYSFMHPVEETTEPTPETQLPEIEY